VQLSPNNKSSIVFLKIIASTAKKKREENFISELLKMYKFNF